MLRTNASQLVELAVHGRVWPVAGDHYDYRTTSGGRGATHIGMAGICFTHRVGDAAFGWEADHLEPGVSIRHPDDGDEHALHYLACMGNDAIVTSGACSGATGVVTGEHAHVLVDFPPEAIEMLAVGDEIQIRSLGTGLQLLDHPDVITHKLSPRLLDALDASTTDDMKLQVGVVAEIPSYLMGSGAELSPDYVDQDFMTGDREEIARLGLDRLRLGDIVAVRDEDHGWGRGFYSGAVTIGLIIHGDSAWTGHGPGVLDLLSSRDGGIVPVRSPDANIALTLGLRVPSELERDDQTNHVSSYAMSSDLGGS
jgi:Domain of unknown function (DUF4438)